MLTQKSSMGTEDLSLHEVWEEVTTMGQPTTAWQR
jgi:hypothetical protein